jgi:hypothetical protein
MLTDITAFSAHRRSDEDRLTLRRVMYDMLQRAFEAARLPWRDLHKEDRGDGTLIVIPRIRRLPQWRPRPSAIWPPR